VVDDPVHHGIVCEEGDDAYLSLAFGTGQWINLIDFSYHLSPAPAGDSRALLLDDQGPMPSFL